MIKLIVLSSLDKIAKFRPSGYKEDVMSRGTVEGKFLKIEMSEYEKLREKYSPGKKIERKEGCCGKNTLKGLGDLVAIPAQGIARMIDKVAGTNVQNCKKCKKRQEKLNELVPFHK